ncbi:hypothetical protein WM16_30580 [Burkholderia ubonensis]|uniref:Uncharacterized protein n=1 Tax=Burkholderia ubonensis TaxID=101571 RepID=A0A108D3A6_9BURK|nr:hypothetical protein WM16_30580 [Burkholderia ubonensis]
MSTAAGALREEPRAVGRFGLRNLVAVMHGDMVFAAAVDIEPDAQILRGHRRALDMPARKSPSPRAVPFHLAPDLGRTEFPQRKVRRVPLRADCNPLAGLQAGAIEPREKAVIVLLAGVEVEAVVGAIHVAGSFDFLNKGDLLRDVIRRAAPYRRLQQVERAPVRLEGVGVVCGYLPRRLAGSPAALFQFVFAFVGVRRQVADVGDVHDMPDFMPVAGQRATQDVLEHVGSQVADMRMVIDGGAAAIQADVIVAYRSERAQGA